MPRNSKQSDDRQKRIFRLLEEHNEVNTAALADRFGVTEMTIRRDLKVLFEKGLARPFYGGAIATRRITLEMQFDQRRNCHLEEKRRIGKAAAERIPEGATVFLDTGTTTLEVAMEIVKRNVACHIITASLAVAGRLWGKGNVRLSLVGGEVRKNSPDLVGPISEWMTEKLSADIAILGSDGIHPKRGSFSAELETARIAERMACNAEKVIVVADHTKIGRRGAARYASFDRIDVIITDRKAKRDDLGRIRRQGVDVLTV
ncbi:MAG: DeoR/GlpR transcriptional regulator [Phycisphaerae bacterium]|nr:DeoR/GlpR transcriptional regulator [Phycisphaerae bacterium]